MIVLSLKDGVATVGDERTGAIYATLTESQVQRHRDATNKYLAVPVNLPGKTLWQRIKGWFR